MNRYEYNPGCACDWCRNNGQVPTGHADNGHAFGYGNEHMPPSRGPFGDRPPRIIALLAFYDEDPDWLTRCVLSLKKVRVTHLIALDGAYALYPDAQPRSSHREHEAIADAADRIGASRMVSAPPSVWDGEVSKRNYLFALAEGIAQSRDWYFVIDADEFVTDAPGDVPARLQASLFDVGAVTLREPGHPLGTIVYPTHPKFFRAIPGLRAVRDHFTYTTPDGRKLWGDAKRARLEPRHDLTAVVVEHHNQLRHPDRRQKAVAYYRSRDDRRVEDLPEKRSLLATRP